MNKQTKTFLLFYILQGSDWGARQERDFWGAGWVLFLDLGVAYTGVLTWKTCTRLCTCDLCGLLWPQAASGLKKRPQERAVHKNLWLETNKDHPEPEAVPLGEHLLDLAGHFRRSGP